MKKKMENRIVIIVIGTVILFIGMTLFLSCQKANDNVDNTSPICVIQDLPDTLQSNVPFYVDATQSNASGGMRVQVRNYPKYHIMYDELEGYFTVYETGTITLWVTVYQEYTMSSDMVEQKVYFK